MASRSTNTMQEGLQRILGDLAQLKTVGDADLAFLMELETAVIGKLREPIDAMKQNAGLPPGPPPGGMGGPGGMPMPAGAMQGGGAMAGPSMPNPDELQRLLNVGQP